MLSYVLVHIRTLQYCTYKYFTWTTQEQGKNSFHLEPAQKIWAYRRTHIWYIQYHILLYTFPKISYLLHTVQQRFESSLIIYDIPPQDVPRQNRSMYRQNQRSCRLASLPHAKAFVQERTHWMVSDVARVVVEMEAWVVPLGTLLAYQVVRPLYARSPPTSCARMIIQHQISRRRTDRTKNKINKIKNQCADLQ